MAVVLASLYLSALVYGLLGLLLDVGVRRLAAWRVGRPDAAVSVKKPVGGKAVLFVLLRLADVFVCLTYRRIANCG